MLTSKIIVTEEWLKKEEMRLKTLYEYDLINMELKELDSITRILSIMCRVPISLISVLDMNCFYVKSGVGSYHKTGDRTLSFCHWTLEEDEILEIKNSLEDERFKDNPYTKGNSPIIYYAGIPLKTITGYNIGVLCIVDHVPRELNEDQRTAFRILANHITMQFELAKFNKELKIANEKANKLAKAKDEFLCNMSHEIRTPLNAIYGFTELLNKTKLDQNQQEMINIVKSSVEILMTIINDILDFSKIESGKLKIDNFPFKIKEVMISLKEIFSQRAKEKNLDLFLCIDKKIPKIINGDRNRITQILINLIGNSIKFTNKGLIKVSLSLAEEDEKRIGIKFSVEDTGIGIETEKKISIFERFEQASNETSRKYGGTGLGLSICKNLVELQGGKLELTSEIDAGSTFYFTLFFDKIEDNKFNDFIKNEIKKKDNKLNNNANDKDIFNEKIKKFCKKKKLEILVCEDTLFNYKLLEKIFGNTLVKLDYAENGKIGLERFQKKSDYDLILLDLQMPIVDGFQLANILRNEKKSDISILALTANNSESEKIRCLDIGMNGYLTKPFKQKNLFEEIINIVFKSKNIQKYSNLHTDIENSVDSDINISFAMKKYDLKVNKENSDPNYAYSKDSFKIKEKNRINKLTNNEKDLNSFKMKRSNLLNILTKRMYEEDNDASKTSQKNNIFNYKINNKKKKILKNSNKTINNKEKYSSIKSYSTKSNSSKKNCHSEGSVINVEMKEILNKYSKKKFVVIYNQKRELFEQMKKYNADYINLNEKLNDLLSLKQCVKDPEIKNIKSCLFSQSQTELKYPNNVSSTNISSNSLLNMKTSEKEFSNDSLAKISDNNPIEDSSFDENISDFSKIISNQDKILNKKIKIISNTNSNSTRQTDKDNVEKKESIISKDIQSNTDNPSADKDKKNNCSSKFSNNFNSSCKEIKNCTDNNQLKECEVVLIDFDKELCKLFTEEEIKSLSINYDILKDISGEDYDIEKDLITIFLKEFPQKLNQLKEAVKTYDLKTIQTISHALKSNVAIFGIDILRNKFLSIEQAVKNILKENKVLQALKNNVNILDNVFIKLKDELLEKYKDIQITED